MKLVSQLFGDRLTIANATGCSSIYGGNLPMTPWTVDADGHGPAWSNSLFEDNAEFGLGLRLAADRHADLARRRLSALREEIGPEPVDEILVAPYFPSVAEEEGGPRIHLRLIQPAAATVDVPVIASLNGVTPAGWTDYARAMQDAGAAAIELNIYYLPGDRAGREVEQRYVDVLRRVKDAVTVPVAVKLGPYFSWSGEIALRLDEAGADGLVLFNHFLQPDIDPESLAVVPSVALSGRADAALPRTWIAILRGRVHAALAATTGVEEPANVAKYLLAGADVVMSGSALLRHGPGHATVLIDGLSARMERKGFQSVDELRGMLSVPSDADGAAYERTGYVTGLGAANVRAYSAW